MNARRAAVHLAAPGVRGAHLAARLLAVLLLAALMSPTLLPVGPGSSALGRAEAAPDDPAETASPADPPPEPAALPESLLRPPTSLAPWEMALVDEPVRPFLDEAMEQERAGRLQRAGAAYRLVLMRDATVAPAVLGLARILARQDRIPEAIEVLRALPNDAEAVAFRARLLEPTDPDTALALYRRLETLDLGAADPYLRQARLLAETDAPAALQALRTWLDLVDGDPPLDGVVEVALGLKEQGLPDEAVTLLERVRTTWPEADATLEIEALLDRIAVEREASRLAVGGAVPLTGARKQQVDRARAAVTEGDLHGALDLLRELVGRAPRSPEAWAALGDVNQELGRIAEAEQAWVTAVTLAPYEASYHARLGMLLAERYGGRRHREAEAELNTALGLRPTWHELLFLLGRVRQQAGDFEGALEAYRSWLEVAPPGDWREEARRTVEDLTRRKPGPPREIRATSAPEDVPEGAWEHYRIARVYRDRGEPGRAREELDLALALAPDFTDARLLDATLHLEAGDEQGAMEAYRACLEQHPDHPRVLLALAELQRSQGRREQAAATFRHAAREGMAEAWYFLATMAEADRRPFEARRLLDAYFAASTGGLVHEPARALGARIDRTLWTWRIAGGILLALVSLGPLAWLLRSRTGVDLQTLLHRKPETWHEVARLLSAIRHEVLKHNTTLLSEVADRLEEGEGEAALYAAERLFGDEDQRGVVRRFETYMGALEAVGRKAGLRLNLRRRDPVMAPMYRAMTRLQRMERALRRPHRPRARRLAPELRSLSRVLNEDGYRAIGELLRSMRLMELRDAFFQQAWSRVAQEPDLQGEAPRTLALEPVPPGVHVHIFPNDLEDVCANLFRNAIRALREELPRERRRTGLRVAVDLDPITGLEQVAIRFLDNAPRPLAEALLRASPIERGLGLAVDLLARHEGVIHVEEEPGWAKAVVVRLPRAETPAAASTPGTSPAAAGQPRAPS